MSRPGLPCLTNMNTLLPFKRVYKGSGSRGFRGFRGLRVGGRLGFWVWMVQED